ncbi:superoxide dismutase [Candidatus Dependentiae bacterium]|nr:superoxide dismutase [Candidatus Dependentiae bacterium]
MIKKYGIFLLALLALVGVILFYSSGKFNPKLEEFEQSCPTGIVQPSGHSANIAGLQPVHYSKKNFNFSAIKGLSAKQLSEHNTLYEGYVNKRNEIAEKLTTVDRSNQNRTYAPYRALKLAETYALNGSLLHELYFENMNNEHSSVGELMNNLITKSFGSFAAFKEDLMAAAQASRGWVLTAYSLDDHLIHNYVLEEHNQTVPVLVMPLLVLDVYEHAYMIDFGIKRASYLDIFWDQIDWNVIEKRIQKWVMPFAQ